MSYSLGATICRSDRLRVQLKDPSTRYRLMPLMRFCSGVHIEPGAVNEAVIDRYMDHRAHTTTRASDGASRRILARLWNAGIGRIDGWPEMRLVEPPVKAAEGPAWVIVVAMWPIAALLLCHPTRWHSPVGTPGWHSAAGWHSPSGCL
jgi:hypothetical protein